jgi:hypothetical protein
VKSFCRAILVLNVLYCLLAAVQPGLPGWHMFEDVERLAPTWTDRDGARIDVRSVLPRGAHLVDRGELYEVVRWFCEEHRDRAPFVLEENGVETTIEADCRMPKHAKR